MTKKLLKELEEHQGEELFIELRNGIVAGKQINELEVYEDNDVNNKKYINICNKNSEISFSIQEDKITSVQQGLGNYFGEVDYRINLIGGISVQLFQ